MKIVFSAKSTFENQLTVEHIEDAVEESGFEVSEVFTLEEGDIAALWAEQENIPHIYLPIKWNDISKCKNPKKNIYGNLYNPQAATERNKFLCKNTNGMIIFWSENDSKNEYIIRDFKKENKRVYFHKPNIDYIF